MTEKIQYIYGDASYDGRELIVGKVSTPNPIEVKRKLVLPLDKMRVGDALLFKRAEVAKWKIALAKEKANVYNRLHDNMFGFVSTNYTFEIVRIK